MKYSKEFKQQANEGSGWSGSGMAKGPTDTVVELVEITVTDAPYNVT